MADYLPRQPSLSNNNVQVKTEELWNNWFTVNKIFCEKIVLDAQSRGENENQPITAEMKEKSDRTDRGGRASETELSKQDQQTVKTISASICEPSNSSLMDRQSDNEVCDNRTIEYADTPPVKTPMCC